MPTQKNTLKNLRHFYLGKMTRYFVLTDTIMRGGQVWYTPLTGTALAKQQVIKLIEEVSEAIKVHNEWQFQVTQEDRTKYRQPVLEELADISNTLTQMSEHIPFHVYPKGEERAGSLQTVLESWQYRYKSFRVVRSYHGVKSDLSELVSYTRNSITKYMRQWDIQPDELAQAIALKNKEKGHLLHGRTEVIALPKNDEWIEYFERNYPVFNPSILKLTKAWNSRPLK